MLRRILIGAVSGAAAVLATLAVIHRGDASPEEKAANAVASAILAAKDSARIDSAAAYSFSEVSVRDSGLGTAVGALGPADIRVAAANDPAVRPSDPVAAAPMPAPLSRPDVRAPASVASTGASGGAQAEAVPVESVPRLPLPGVSVAPLSTTPALPAAPVASVERTSIALQPVPELPPPELPDATEIRAAVTRVASGLRSGTYASAEIEQFFKDGADFRSAPVQAPTSVADGDGRVRVRVELRLSKFDAGGRPVIRLVPLSMDLRKLDGTVSISSVALGAARRP